MEIMETYDNRLTDPHIDLPRRIAGNAVTNRSLWNYRWP